MHALQAPVVWNRQIAERTWQIRLICPTIAQQISPGQFVMVRLPDSTDPLLGRPFALYDCIADDTGSYFAIDIVYLVVGKITEKMTHLQPGNNLEIWGPLGKGFPLSQAWSVVNCVAGGIGQTPFLAYANELLGQKAYAGRQRQQYTSAVRLYYGVRTAAYAAGINDFQNAGCEVHLATDDGSSGTTGRVTEILAQQQPEGLLVGCGPEPMLHALIGYANTRNQECYVSLETPMACGFGVCFSCVTQVKTATGWDYQRVCVDGPVFRADQLVLPGKTH
ncbi:MAG: dihydroorotate dehydrogenase electron transfer subunit [Zavarzinella sp.]